MTINRDKRRETPCNEHHEMMFDIIGLTTIGICVGIHIAGRTDVVTEKKLIILNACAPQHRIIRGCVCVPLYYIYLPIILWRTCPTAKDIMGIKVKGIPTHAPGRKVKFIVHTFSFLPSYHPPAPFAT